MKTLELTFDHFQISGELIPGLIMLKDLQLELLKPDNTMRVRVKAPLIQNLHFEFRIDAYENGMLTLFILSKRKMIDALLNLAERFAQLPEYIRIDYPYFYLDIDLLTRESLPGLNIKDFHIAEQNYHITLELP